MAGKESNIDMRVPYQTLGKKYLLILVRVI
jgi:hypothetical protein